jgi:hypothetical protein
MNKLLLLIILLSGIIPLRAQMAGEQLMYADKTLSWNHYNVRTKGTGNLKAFSYTGVSYAVRESDGKFVVSLGAYLDNKQSWVVKGAATVALLQHEQVLFALTEVYARKMRKEVADFFQQQEGKIQFSQLLEQVRNIYRRLNNELFMQQQFYNAQTKNGTDPVQQKKWNEHIARQMKELEAFSESLQWFEPFQSSSK